MPRASLPHILVIGHDEALTYLIERYAERGGFGVIAQPIVPALPTVRDWQPIALIFTSMEDFEAAQTQLAHFEIPLIVCSSVNDQSRAHELGADQCLVHPVNYDSFVAAMSVVHASPRG